jgi:arginase
VKYDIQIIAAPSILGLRPSGTEKLAGRLLENGLRQSLRSTNEVITVPDLNADYSAVRDPQTNCLNASALKTFSLSLMNVVGSAIQKDLFPLVLGGDCSILLGIMPALKMQSTSGLIFMDAHADFYSPDKSPTGEVADMDLAIITGRGPELLTNINGLKPYVLDKHAIHVGQRDHFETEKYGSPDIRKTSIKNFDLGLIRREGVSSVADQIVFRMTELPGLRGFWVHFDTDVLTDEINPAVDYRLPGGLLAEEVQLLLKRILSSGRILGMSVSIYNPLLDANGGAGRSISECLVNAFTMNHSKSHSLPG